MIRTLLLTALVGILLVAAFFYLYIWAFLRIGASQ